MKIGEETTAGWEPAFRGMRNPMNSWDRSDSKFYSYGFAVKNIGPADLRLAQNLVKAGTEHGKFARMIQVWVDIEAPFYWWKEFDTYRVGVEKNSCSTMHKIMSRPLTVDDFAFDEGETGLVFETLTSINSLIELYKIAEDKEEKEGLFRAVVQLLPSAYLQKRTVMMSYAALRNIYFQRRNHKLSEWREFCGWVEGLPYAAELICIEKEAEE